MQTIHIIGGGEFGLAAAYALTNRGYKDITIYDRLPIPATDASSTDINKIVRMEYGSDILYQTLAIESIRLWKEWNQDCLKKFGVQMYHETGVLMASSSNSPTTYENTSFESIKNAGLAHFIEKDVKIPSLKQMREKLAFGHLNRLGGWVHSSMAITYIASILADRGVQFKTGNQGHVTSILYDQERIIGFETAEKQKYFGTCLFCTGAWTPVLLPQTAHVMTPIGQPVVHISIPDSLDFKDCPVWGADLAQLGFYGFPPTNGVIKIAHHGAGYYSSQGPKTIITNPSTGSLLPLDFLTRLDGFLKEYIPALSTLEIRETRVCWYCDSWDGDFYICPLQENIFIAAGGSGHGFKFMPVIGDIIADMMENKQSEYTKRFAWREPAIKKLESSRSAQGTAQDLDSIPLQKHSKL